MAKNPTIVAASLDDNELKKSVESLVLYVGENTRKMATNFDNTINSMKKKLAEFGNVSFDAGGSADGGSLRRSKKNKDEAQSVKDLTMTYDQLAAAVQRAIQPKSAQDSFYTFIQSYRERVAALARELKQMPNASLDRQFAEYQRFEAEIERTQARIRELRVMLNEVGRNPNASRFEIKAITDEIGLLEGKIRALTSEQIQSTRRIATEDSAAMSQKQALYDKTLQLIREMTAEQKQDTAAINTQIDAQERLNRKVQRQAEIIRQRMAESGNQFATWGSAVIYDPSIKKDHASIEEQLLNAHKEQLRITQERIAAEQREKQEKQEALVITQQQAQAEQQVTLAQQQRSGVKSTPKTFQDYEDFKAALAHVLGLQRQEINLANEETASYDRLSSTLKTLQAAYYRLSASERNSENGRAVVASMHEVERALQKIRQQAARPVNLQQVLGLPEKTLDDISYKLQAISIMRGQFEPQSRELQELNAAYQRLSKTQREALGNNKELGKSNGAVARSLNYIKNRLAFYFTIGASTSFVKNLIEIRGQYELLERSIGILVNSAQRGSQIFSELNTMAIKSPFTTMELGAAAKQLVAFDVAADEVVDTTRRLADMAAAVGVPIGRLTYALGQIKAYGYLNARDARMFANAGIPLVKELADHYTNLEGRLVSVADVYDRIKKKAIDYTDVMQVVNEMTDEGGKFFNFQEKAAHTLRIRIANLNLAWNNMLNEIGKDNQGLLSSSLNLLKGIFERWRSIQNAIYAAIAAYGIIKASQIFHLLLMRQASAQAIIQVALGKRLANTYAALRTTAVGLNTAMNAATLGVAAVAFVLGKLVFDYMDLTAANENFNKSIRDGAEENIKSINKFFDDYHKELDKISSAKPIDQQKMWERLKEEIKLTTKNASQYIDALNKIEDVVARIKAGEAVLEQTKIIEGEAKKLADIGAFDIGGGFADKGLAKNLADYEKRLRSLIKDFGSLEEAEKKHSGDAEFLVGAYKVVFEESGKEINRFISNLDKANIDKIIGDDPEAQLSNLRQFAHIIRDQFLATEDGAKLGMLAITRLNSALDKWIADTAASYSIIKNENVRVVEANRTAWESFFDQLNKKEKQRLDYLIKTNQTGSNEFVELWNKAAKNLQESASGAYDLISEQIENLRNQPDIVINVVYKERVEEETDKQRKAFTEKFIEPKQGRMLTADAYEEARQENIRKYQRYIKKENEDNVEWEKRLGEEYVKNEKSIKSLNSQLSHSAKLSKEDREAKKKELDTLKDQQAALKDIEISQGFNYAQFNKTSKGKQPEDYVAEALKQELSVIKEMQSSYEKLRKAGVSNTDALNLSAQGYEATLNRINATLTKYGISNISASDFAGKDVNQLLETLRKQRGDLLASGKVKTSSLKDLDVEIQKLTIDAKTYNLKKITDGLNNELGRIKEEYELAVELDADPELGGMFAKMFAVDMKSLPHTFDETLKRVQTLVDKKLSDLGINKPLNILSTDLEAFATTIGRELDSNVIAGLKNVQKFLKDLWKKTTSDAIKNWSTLQEKYGTYQTKLLKIAKDTAQEQLNVARRFGSEEQMVMAADLARRIQISSDPEQVARLEGELAQLIEKVVSGNKTAANIAFAVTNSSAKQTAKLEWDNFKDSDLYATTFEDMDRVSTRAIKDILAQLDLLKDKVKADPASMKALMKAYKDGRDELEKRKPFESIIEALNEMKTAHQEVKAAQQELTEAEEESRQAHNALDAAQRQTADIGEPEKLKNIADATKRVADADGVVIAKKKKLATAETNERNAQAKFQAALQASAQALENIGSLLKQFTDLLGFAEDSEEAEMVQSLVKGFSTMASVLSMVAAAALLAQMSLGWVAVIAAALAVVVGLISFISNSGNRKINRAVKDSERSVKRLENALKNLEQAVDDAYGEAVFGAEAAVAANKELQLAEKKRQLELEKSRREKDKDEEKIADLQGEIYDLENDVKKSSKDIVNHLLDISSVGDAAEELAKSLLEAFKNGEDYMKVYEDSFDEMIDSMIAKVIASRVIGQRLQQIFDVTDEMVKAKIGTAADDYAAAQKENERVKNMSDKQIAKEMAEQRHKEGDYFVVWSDYDKEDIEEYRRNAEERMLEAQRILSERSTLTVEDINSLGNLKDSYLAGTEEELKAWFDAFGVTFGENGGELSKLQQGIQGITEDTAGALEAYMNGVSQQVYLQSDILTQIRDSITEFDYDIQTATIAQILLQLQASYNIQMSIQNILSGWSNYSGQAIRVEMI